MSYSDFLKLTEQEFNAIYEKWIDRDGQRERQAWEIARWQVFRIACPPQGRGKEKIIKITDFVTFPWEKESEITEKSTRDRFEELKNKWQ